MIDTRPHRHVQTTAIDDESVRSLTRSGLGLTILIACRWFIDHVWPSAIVCSRWQDTSQSLVVSDIYIWKIKSTCNLWNSRALVLWFTPVCLIWIKSAFKSGVIPHPLKWFGFTKCQKEDKDLYETPAVTFWWAGTPTVFEKYLFKCKKIIFLFLVLFLPWKSYSACRHTAPQKMRVGICCVCGSGQSPSRAAPLVDFGSCQPRFS